MQIRDLLRLHLAGMHETSPPGAIFALDLSGLAAAEVSFYAAWDGPELLGFAALKQISAEAGEIKSMRTHPDHLRRGVGGALLSHIVSVARNRGYRRLSLETGSGPDFEAAAALYLRNGFAPGAAFADYAQSAFNRFFHRAL